jgi:hypothetical protein
MAGPLRGRPAWPVRTGGRRAREAQLPGPFPCVRCNVSAALGFAALGFAALGFAALGRARAGQPFGLAAPATALSGSSRSGLTW